MNKTVRTYQQLLNKIGFPIKADGVFGPKTKEAVRDFSVGFAFFNVDRSPYLSVRTKAAIRYSAARGGKASAHFYFREFKSKGNGWIKVNRGLVRGLEKMRKAHGPVRILSGYRDPAHNKKVGGATNSQHMYGNAVDLASPHLSATTVKRLRAFTGLGISRSTGKVLHVDVRPGGSTSAPTTWYYA